jgi:hypothetical protein
VVKGFALRSNSAEVRDAPQGPRHQCRGRNKFNCLALVRPPDKYCDGCKGRLSQHDAARRGSPAQRGLDADWQQYSARFRQRFKFCGHRPEDALIRNVAAAWACYVKGFHLSAARHACLSMADFVRALGGRVRDGYLFPKDAALDPFSQCRRAGRLTDVRPRNSKEVAAGLAVRGLVDHITPVRGAADALFLREDNHQSLCVPCHAAKTGAERAVASA